MEPVTKYKTRSEHHVDPPTKQYIPKHSEKRVKVCYISLMDATCERVAFVDDVMPTLECEAQRPARRVGVCSRAGLNTCL